MHRGLLGRPVKNAPQWQVEVEVAAPLAAVWDAVDDLSLIPEYHPEVRHVEFLSGQARRARGVRYKCVVPGDREGSCVEEVVEHEPFQHTTAAIQQESRGTAGRVTDFLTEISVEPRGAGETLLRLRAWYRPRGWFARALNPFLSRRAMRSRAGRTLAGLKRLVERRARAGMA